MDPPTTTQPANLIQSIGTSWIPGNRLVILHLRNATPSSWIGRACLNSQLNQAIAKLPAENVIMSIHKDMPSVDIIKMTEKNNERVCGILIASRGVAQATPCQECQAHKGSIPFEDCFIIRKYSMLGCAASVFWRGDGDREDDASEPEDDASEPEEAPASTPHPGSSASQDETMEKSDNES